MLSPEDGAARRTRPTAVNERLIAVQETAGGGPNAQLADREIAVPP